MAHVPLQPGALTARLDKKIGLVLEGADEQPVGSVRWKGAENFGAKFEAADGAWTVPGVGGSKWKGPDSWSVRDASGTEVGTLSKGSSSRAITSPGGPLTWEHRALGSPHYSIEGMYSANRTAKSRLVPGLTKKHFEVEVTDKLVARPDASIVLLLAAWCTHHHIESKIDAD